MSAAGFGKIRVTNRIALRIGLLGWMVTLLTLAIFVTMIVPEQKREFKLNLESKARGVVISLRSVAAGAAVSQDYSAVVEQALLVLSGDSAIDYLVITKNDGFSLVVDRSSWRIANLGIEWRPAVRVPTSSILVSPLFGRRVFQYGLPFDYSGIQWGWIHIGLSLDAYDASVRRTYQTTGALGLLCGCMSLLISLAYAARLVRPIETLQAAVEKVAQGDLRARADVRSHDEIAHLANAFNDMARTILGHNQILESVSFAAKQLLSAIDPGVVTRDVLERVGQATASSRAYVLRKDTTEPAALLVPHDEWQAQAASTEERPWQSFPWLSQDARGWVEALENGRIVTIASRELEQPLRQSLDPRLRSAVFVPVEVAGEWWGVIGLDDFQQERVWGEAEKDSLRAVADMLGASIARNQVRMALIESKETLEQRVVERTSELETAQQLLAQNLERLDLALECAEEALWDWDLVENRTFYSERWSRMLGFDPEDFGDSNQVWEFLVHPNDLPGAMAKMHAHLERQTESYQAEFRMRTKDGGWRWIRARGKVVARSPEGRALRLTGTHLDITASKQAEEAMIELSREAGMAEVATGVLHNVGNVLNSVNVSTSVIAGKIRESRVDNLVSAIDLLARHADDLPGFLTNDPKGQRVLPYLTKVGQHLRSERESMMSELELLSSHVGHIKQIVATQQGYAKVSGLVENVSLTELADDALRILQAGLIRHKIKVELQIEPLPLIAADRHKIIQILLNLMRNAKQSIEQAEVAEGMIRIRIERAPDRRVRLAVEDNGVGLLPENLTRIFAHGFTTKPNGHGFGLHSCALAASQMGGSLRAESEGPGRGATFLLELPMKTTDDIKELLT